MLRVEGDRDAVQIMTMHQAKGLEADVVFVYGGFSPAPNDGVRSYVGRRPRLAAGGPPAPQAHRRPHQARARRRGPAPLLRRADARAASGSTCPTRARCRERGAAVRRRHAGGSTGGSPAATGTSTAGCASCWPSPTPRRLFDAATSPIERAPRRAPPAAPPRRSPPGGPSPTPSPIDADPALARAAARARAGAVTTSYSRIKQAHGGYRPPTEILDEVAGAPTPARRRRATDELPGGARAGIFLHALLEELPLERCATTPALEAWSARDDVRALSRGRCCAGTGAMPRDLAPPPCGWRTRR